MSVRTTMLTNVLPIVTNCIGVTNWCVLRNFKLKLCIVMLMARLSSSVHHSVQ
jgi:hypothetical protein